MSWPAFGRIARPLFWGLALGWMESVSAGAFDHAHPRWALVLRAHLREGTVDYAGIQAAPANLKAYLDEVAGVSREEFGAWSQPRQLAFLFNLYNAATLDLVSRHYPVKSIKEIGTFLRGPWKQDCVRLWGEAKTLDYIEHDLLRKDYREPRLHFALVCAARSCPPLRHEPYVGDRLDAQLEEQGRAFLAQPEKNRVDAQNRTLHLSPIFLWFKGDFVAGGRTIGEFVEPYLPEGSPRSVGRFRIRYTVYDWRLNDRTGD